MAANVGNPNQNLENTPVGGTNTSPRLYKNFRFNIQVKKKTKDQNNMIRASFASVSGFEASYDLVEFRTGIDESLAKKKYAGLVKYGNITLSRGISDDQEFYDWIAGGLDKNNLESAEVVTINLLDDIGQKTVASWELYDVWPIKYIGPYIDARKVDIAVEKLELAHNGIKRIPFSK